MYSLYLTIHIRRTNYAYKMAQENDQVQDLTATTLARGFSDILIDVVLPNLEEYGASRVSCVLSDLFKEGRMFRMTASVRDALDRITEDETTPETRAMMEFLTDLARDTPQRFVELVRIDTLNVVLAQHDYIYQRRHISPERERRNYLDEKADELEELLGTVAEPTSTEYFHLDYEAYQENDETRHRFMMVYHS